MCYCVKFVLRGAWLSTFSRDAMRIICLSLVGRWWRAEWETGLLLDKANLANGRAITRQVKGLS